MLPYNEAILQHNLLDISCLGSYFAGFDKDTKFDKFALNTRFTIKPGVYTSPDLDNLPLYYADRRNAVQVLAFSKLPACLR